MARIWTCGFELNTLTAGVEVSAIQSTPALVNSGAHGGTYALQIAGLASTVRLGTIHQFISALTSGPLFIRFYFKYHTAPTANNRFFQLCVDSTATSASAVSVWIASNGSLALFNSGGAAQIGSNSAPLSADTWYRVEIKWDRSPAAGSQEIRGYINGTEFAGANNLTITNQAMTIFFGGNLNASAQTQGEWYIDDVAINNNTGTVQNTLPGEGKIVVAVPSASGDNAATTGVYSYINEIPPSDTATTGVTMVELDTTTAIGDYKVTAPGTLGIADNDTVNVVEVLGRIREEAAGTSNYTLRLKSASGGTVASSTSIDAGDATVRTNPSTTTAFGTKLISHTDPTTAARWTVTGINSLTNMQIGAATTDGNPDIWVLGLYALIDYTPTAAGPLGMKTALGLAKASVKTMNSLAIASVKTANGLA